MLSPWKALRCGVLAAAGLGATIADAAVVGSRSTPTQLPLQSAAAIRVQSDASASSSAKVDGVTYKNHGLVAFGRISNSAVDSYGETLGGLGSAIALETLSKNDDGSYAGTIRLQPDRGHNLDGAATTDYRARSHLFKVQFTPLDHYDKDASEAAEENLKLTYDSTLLYKYNGAYSTGLDPNATHPQDEHKKKKKKEKKRRSSHVAKHKKDKKRRSSATPLPWATIDGHLPLDLEGLVNLGSHLLASDEYGPNVYLIEKNDGNIADVLTPPPAVVPVIDSHINFTSLVNPDSGRVANQGFEGLTFDRSTGTLWALLQSALVQDGGGDKTTSLHTRLFGWEVDLATLKDDFEVDFNFDIDEVHKRDEFAASKKHKKRKGESAFKLKYEYVVTLPVSKKGKSRASSELHIVSSKASSDPAWTFLALARDGDGLGDDSSDSSYKNAALFTTKGATNIAGTEYSDSFTGAVAPDGKLAKGVTAATVEKFVDLVDADELAKFGLHVGGDIDQNLVAAKLESLALAHVEPASTTSVSHAKSDSDEYFLFVVSDNDFITTDGHTASQVDGKGEYVIYDYSDPYAKEYFSEDTQVFVYKVTLPSYKQPGSKSSPN